MEALKKKWAELTPKKKKKAVLLAIVIMVLFLAMITYRPKKGAKTAAQSASDGKTISLDSGMLKKSEYMDVQKQLSDFKNEIVKLKAQKAAVANGTAAPVEKSEKPARVQPPIPKYIPSLSVPRASSYPRGYPPLPEEEIKKPALTPTPQIIGGIEVVEGPPGKRAPQETGEAKKKQSESVYLPPSFMEATLLTGLDAPTAEGAKGEPVPVLLRIKAPAVLPNRVKANLKGCTVCV